MVAAACQCTASPSENWPAALGAPNTKCLRRTWGVRQTWACIPIYSKSFSNKWNTRTRRNHSTFLDWEGLAAAFRNLFFSKRIAAIRFSDLALSGPDAEHQRPLPRNQKSSEARFAPPGRSAGGQHPHQQKNSGRSGSIRSVEYGVGSKPRIFLLREPINSNQSERPRWRSASSGKGYRTHGVHICIAQRNQLKTN